MKISNKVLSGLAIVVVIILVIIAYTKSGSETDTGPIKIGFIGPLTGDAAGLGTFSRSAVELAIDEVNKDGGVNGRQLQVIYEDGQCLASPAVSAAKKLINIDKVTAIIGGLCSSETSAFTADAMKNKKIVISYCSSAPSLSNTGEYFFRTYPSDANQGKFAAEYAYNTLGARKIAIIYHISDWGTGIKDVFTKRFSELGGVVVTIEGSSQETRDYRTQVAKIKASDFDLVYTPVYVDGGIVLLKQLSNVGISGVKILGTETFNDPKFLTETKTISNDIVITASKILPSNKFAKNFTTKTGVEAVPVCAPQAYDAVKVLAGALEKVGTNPDKLKDAIRKTNYQGESGQISFDENGDLQNSTYVVKKIQNGVVVDF